MKYLLKKFSKNVRTMIVTYLHPKKQYRELPMFQKVK